MEWVRKESIFFDKGCFIAQQAAEKALKACLYARGERRVIGYSVYVLVDRLSRVENEFQAIADEARRLDRFYIPTRYPNGLPGGSPFQIFTAADLAGAYEDLRQIISVCRDFLERMKIIAHPGDPLQQNSE